MVNLITRGYVNSNAIKTSVQNQVVIDDIPEECAGAKIYKFKFLNLTDCTIEIYRGAQLLSVAFLKHHDGWAMNENDDPITNIKIREAGVLYKYQGAFKVGD